MVSDRFNFSVLTNTVSEHSLSYNTGALRNSREMLQGEWLMETGGETEWYQAFAQATGD